MRYDWFVPIGVLLIKTLIAIIMRLAIKQFLLYYYYYHYYHSLKNMNGGGVLLTQYSTSIKSNLNASDAEAANQFRENSGVGLDETPVAGGSCRHFY